MVRQADPFFESLKVTLGVFEISNQKLRILDNFVSCIFKKVKDQIAKYCHAELGHKRVFQLFLFLVIQHHDFDLLRLILSSIFKQTKVLALYFFEIIRHIAN